LKLEFKESLDNFDLVVNNCVSLKPTGELITEESGLSLKSDDFVYLPHRACLTMQIAGACVQLGKQDQVDKWIKASIQLASQPGITRSKLDIEMGKLAQVYSQKRKSYYLLTFEIIYLLQQMPKLPNSVLLQVITEIQSIMKKLDMNLNCSTPKQYIGHPFFPDFVSGLMLTIVCYCFLGDSEIALLFSARLVSVIDHLDADFAYL